MSPYLLLAFSIVPGVTLGLCIAYSAAFFRRAKVQKGSKEARELARDILPKKEFERLQRHGYIEATGKSQNQYRIRRGRPVEIVGKYGLCVHPRGGGSSYPEEDLVVMYYLYITADEEHFLRTANPMGRV